MYEHLRNELLALLENSFDGNGLQKILTALDKVMQNYDVTDKCTGVIVYGSDIPEIVKTYLVCRKIEGLSENTLYNYKMHLHDFFNKVRKNVSEVTANDIRIYLFDYQKERGITDRSLDKLRNDITAFFEWSCQEEYIPKNPARKIPPIKYEKTERQSLSQIELEYIRKACISKRDKAVVEMLYSTGCRRAELVGIKISDIDFAAKKVHLFGKGKKHRDSFLNAKAEVAILDYINSERKGNSEFLFVSERKPYGKLKKNSLGLIVDKISERASLQTGKHVTPHIFRHTTATVAMQNGMPIESIQLMFGHSKIDTTMVYAHADTNAVQSQHSKSVI